MPPSIGEFEGYGGAARVVFIGVEERRRGELSHQVEVRKSFSRRMDLREACDRLFTPGWWDTEARVEQPVWNMASRIYAAISGSSDWHGIRENHLGRKHHDALLTELLPIPLVESGAWSIEDEETFGYKDYESYRRAQLGSKRQAGPRTALIRRLLAEAKPDFVFCYGASSLGFFQRLFPELKGRDWQRRQSAPNGVSPQDFHAARWGTTKIVVTRHYSNFWGRPLEAIDIPALLTSDR